MPRYRLTKIYTRTGDDGTTGMGSGERVPKDGLRMEAIGTVDELNAVIGLALTKKTSKALRKMFTAIQNDLFAAGADLCISESRKNTNSLRITDEHVRQLESFLDTLLARLKPLENFILPGGTFEGSHLHLARCVCRRAERAVVRLRRKEPASALCAVYLNRLSDLLFVMARHENASKKTPETLWAQGTPFRA